MGAPDLSVVIVSWRTRELTLACLRSLDAEAARGGLCFETVLVDNASGDGTVEAVGKHHPAVRVLVNTENVGFAAGCNRAIGESSGRHVLLLNPDAEVEPGTLGRVVRFLDETPRAAAVGCRLVSPGGDPQFSCGRFLTPVNQAAETVGLSRLIRSAAFRRSYAAGELRGEAVEVDWAVGACLGLRRSALEAVGRLDERFFMYSEDEDLCYRLRSSGWAVYVLPQVSVRHAGGRSAAQDFDRMRRAARRSQAAFIRKHRGRAAELLFRALTAVAALKPRRHPDRVGWGQ